MIPPKLAPGSHVRIVAPSCTLPSLPWMTDAFLAGAKKFFEDRGMTVSEGKHLREMDEFQSTSITARVEDLHDAFKDPGVHALIAIRGGWNGNQLLTHLDYDLIAKNPKVLCGFSDNTAIQNAILAKTGLVTYSGPNFTQFGMGDQLRYTHEMFAKCVMEAGEYEIVPSREWTNDRYSPEHPQLAFEPNGQPWVLQEGETDGRIVGGNLCTLNLLQGTEYMPQLPGAVLFLEDDHESDVRRFDRNLQSLAQQPGFDEAQAIVFGRFEKATEMTKDLLKKIVSTKPEFEGMAIIANVDFGHTHPMATFPVGGMAAISAFGTESRITVTEH